MSIDWNVASGSQFGYTEDSWRFDDARRGNLVELAGKLTILGHEDEN
jgi:hypothetical protein